MRAVHRHRLCRARGSLEAFGVAVFLILPLSPAGAVTDETHEKPEARSTTQRWPQVLPNPFRPMEDTTDRLMAGLIRLLPSGKHLPHHLRDREHDDYPLVFQWIPRSWTTFGWGRPKLMLGNQDNWQEGSPKPIGNRGSFQISRYPELPWPLSWMPLYFAATSPGGVHIRLGARWDDVDSYTQFPSIAWKRKVE